MHSGALAGVVAVTAALLAAGPASADPWLDRLHARPAAEIDADLSRGSFRTWLEKNVYAALPPGVRVGSTLVPCPVSPADCLMLEIPVPSRARTLSLHFDRATQRFRSATLGGPELEAMPPITALADLPKRLAAPIRPYPLTCPDGTRLVLEEEHAGLREWCEDASGRKQGPGRAWFSTGRYLMHRGAWRDDARTGRWFQCNRFERCRWVDYSG